MFFKNQLMNFPKHAQLWGPRLAELSRQLVIQRSRFHPILLNRQGMAPVNSTVGEISNFSFSAPTVCVKVQKTLTAFWVFGALKKLQDLVYLGWNGREQCTAFRPRQPGTLFWAL